MYNLLETVLNFLPREKYMRKLTELFKVRLRWLTPRRMLSRMRILIRVRAMEVVMMMEAAMWINLRQEEMEM